MNKLTFSIIASLLFIGSGHAASDQPLSVQPELNQCIALRGNGDRVVATFAALSRFSDHYGLVDGIAGSSSGSIGAFIYESMSLNPQLRKCGDEECSSEVIGLRLGLMLKTLFGYSEFLMTTNAGERVKNVMSGDRKIKDVASALLDDNLRKFLKWGTFIPSFRGLFNIKKHISRVKGGAGGLEVKKGEGAIYYVRNGVLNTKYIADLVGRVGDFYANRGSNTGELWQTFFDKCTPDEPGVGWPAIATKPLNRHVSQFNCHAYFQSLLLVHRKEYFENLKGTKHKVKIIGSHIPKTVYDRNTPVFKKRMDDLVGDHMPTVVGTSAFIGEAAFDEFKQVKKDYDRFKMEKVEPFKTWPRAFRVGYFSSHPIGQAIVSNPMGFEDLKSQRAYHLGNTTWKDAVVASITEPGIGTARVFDKKKKILTGGGWVDNHATLALKNMGCKNTIYITRRGHDSNFARTVAEGAGFSQEMSDSLFNNDDAKSSINVSLLNSDVVWCTDWDEYKVGLSAEGLGPLVDSGFKAPMFVRDSHSSYLPHSTRPFAYFRATTNEEFVGCKPIE